MSHDFGFPMQQMSAFMNCGHIARRLRASFAFAIPAAVMPAFELLLLKRAFAFDNNLQKRTPPFDGFYSGGGGGGGEQKISHETRAATERERERDGG